MNNKEFEIKLGNCSGLIYQMKNNILFCRFKNSSQWFIAQEATREYIKNNPNLINYLEKENG